MPPQNSAQIALDLLILTLLDRRGPLHGYALANFIEDLSDEALRVEEGSLYPALHRMEEKGWVAAEWTITESKRRARQYSITTQGQSQLFAEAQRWAGFSMGVARVLQQA
ncbi:PadR family transcriptional regulator [uncultured Paludibaculum sp.]|uniref:PadR family transcriptional regulator n=1 Tax=uncultured Paludibaculum sp. TaxID=1765020 RepID=UPI002AABF21B|nr:PadR family transcriptional regulator [uncultured Paludibaculum sp.]